MPMGPVRAQTMFGGHGLFLDDLMFGLLETDTLWLKADDLNRATYTDAGARAFTYRRQGKDVALSFYGVPDELWFDRDTLIAWCESALAAAKRNKQKSRRS